MNWDSSIQKVSPYLVKIETPSGSGTGFLCAYNETRTFCCIATALHVVSEADEWQQPIKIHTHDFKKQAFLKESERVIFPNRKTDSAVIIFAASALDLPGELIPLRPIENPISIGNEVGWLGYPSIEPWTLCFFSGNVSARREDRSAYLIDGVAINGVSGGPVLYSGTGESVQFVGIVSAYRANRQYGDSLPGLLIAQDVSYFHQVVQHIRSQDEARKKRAQMESKEPKGQQQQGASPPSASTGAVG